MSWASNPTTEMPPAPADRQRLHLPHPLVLLGLTLALTGTVGVVVFAPQLLGWAPRATSNAAPNLSDLPGAAIAPNADGSSDALPTVRSTASQSAATVEEAMEELIFGGTNAERERAGCAPLKLDPKLRAAARRQALDMATQGFQSHTGSDGSEPPRRIADAGYDASNGWAENVARGYPNVTAVMAGWLESPSHRAEILRCTWKSIGIGVARAGDGELFYAQEFGGR